MTPFSVAIIAGGKSTRMGTNKAFVDLDGRSVIAHLLGRISNLGQSETFVITNHPENYEPFGLPVYGDILQNKGPLGGIYTALTHSENPFTLMLACDMPFVNPKLLDHIMTLRVGGPFDAIIPRVNGRPEGMHAAYRKTCLSPIRRRLDVDRLKVTDFYEDVRVRYVDEAEWQPFAPKGLSFYNVNTPEELTHAQQLAQDQS